MARKSPQIVIGGFVFNVYGGTPIESFERTIDYRWEGLERISQVTAHQFLGEGVEQISFQGSNKLILGGSMYQMEGLRDKAKKGKPLIVTTGTGKNLGKFVIIKISESFKLLMDDSRAQELGFSVELKKYGDD